MSGSRGKFLRSVFLIAIICRNSRSLFDWNSCSDLESSQWIGSGLHLKEWAGYLQDPNDAVKLVEKSDWSSTLGIFYHPPSS